ncbi:MAG: LysR family transcriptional regulator [Lautropia sp.]
MHFRKFDLNLLVALDALLRERSVTRAADNLFMSQSAMSHALSRLRDMLGDALLVRGPGGLILTPLAEELREPVYLTLLSAETVLGKGMFSPASTNLVFTLGTTDYFDSLLLPRLTERMRREAPHARILVRNVVREHLRDDLARGNMDLAISFVPRTAAHAKPLFAETYSCVMRAGAGKAPRSITLEQYLQRRHVLVSPSGSFAGAVDNELARKRQSRAVAVSTPRYLSAAEIVTRSDLVLTVQTRLARKFLEYLPVHVVDLPFAMPAQSLVMQWSERTHGDAAYRWLRKMIVELGEP